jgi:hypothetical protein
LLKPGGESDGSTAASGGGEGEGVAATATVPSSSSQLLSRTLAEEIRLLIPPRLQLLDEWTLLYSLDRDGVSLATLYSKCAELQALRRGYVIVVKDGLGGV